MPKGFIGTTTSHFGRYCWGALVVLCVLAVLALVFAFLGWPYFHAHRERFVWAALIAFLAMIIPPVWRMARERNRHMLYVAIWGVTITIVVLFALYTSFFLYVGDNQLLQQRYQPILALAPVLSGLMLGAVGWYIHYQKTNKDERTAAAFKILMDTRTSSEFLRFQRDLRVVYPPGTRVTDSDRHLFPPHGARLEEVKKRELLEETDKEKKLSLVQEIAKLEAIAALNYLLNHYEFVAQAIRVGDLDEDLLYETVSASVVSLFDRGAVLIEHIQRDNQPLAFQHLKGLVHQWRQRLRQEEADLLNKPA